MHWYPMMKLWKQTILVIAVTTVLSVAPPVQAGRLNVAVFNFQMTSETPEWVWLEKGLSDRIATDFTQSRVLTVTARDAMQVLARKLNWVPEMATSDPKRMKQIRRQLRIENIVSGIYSIEDGQLTITAQIVDVKTRQELARKVVTGKADDVLKLQRLLSAELMSWFTKRPARQILPTLPVWTRSLPAMKALYEGMDLYDQGRYAEGWLKFRQASRKDPAYIEARYWVGKMYYFMDRYEHARRAIEKFVYMDESHPRIIDAVIEYLHTYESSDVSIETLLKLYADMERRFPDKKMPIWPNEKMKYFMRKKAGLLLVYADRQKKALMVFTDERRERLETLFDVASKYENLLWHRHRWLTGEIFPGKTPITADAPETVFGNPNKTFVVRTSAPCSYWVSKARKVAYCRLYHISPSGYVATSIRLFPETNLSRGQIKVSVGKDRYYGIGPKSDDIAKAVKEGFLFDNLPPAGILHIRCEIRPDEPVELAEDVLSNMRIETKFRKLGPHGSIYVACTNASRFRVDVDGRLGRINAGLIGLLKPGEHTLRFYSPVGSEHLGERTVKFTVEAGKTKRLVTHLPWGKDSPWGNWFSGTLLEVGESGGAIGCFVMDDHAVRMILTSGGDLWYSSSTDGQTFSGTRKINLPVSSGWKEWRPVCFRDESGRYILMFLSNRDAQHRNMLYACWSRDFVNWSAPAQAMDRPFYGPSDIIQDNRGRFLLAASDNKGIKIYKSRDGLQWKYLGCVNRRIRGSGFAVELLERDDGTYELFDCRPKRRNQESMSTHLVRYVSADAVTWSKDEVICEIPGNPSRFLSAVHSNGRTTIMLSYTYTTRKPYEYRSFLVRERADGAWERTKDLKAFANNRTVIASHPRWGCIIAWNLPFGRPRDQGLLPKHFGPYVIRGPGLDKFRYAQIEPYKSEPVVVKKPPTPKPLPPGQLQFEAKDASIALTSKCLKIEESRDFRKSDSSMLTLTSRAKIATLKSGDLTFHVALDWSNPKFKYPDKLHVDFTGKGDFKNAHVLKRNALMREPPQQSYTCEFAVALLRFKHNGLDYPVNLFCQYTKSPRGEKLVLWLGTVAKGLCYFGKRLYRIHVLDANSNLCFSDAVKPAAVKDNHIKFDHGDFIWVYHEKGPVKDSGMTAAYGQPICVDGVLYDVKVSADGTKVSAEPCAGRTAKIRINHPSWRIWLLGRKRFFVLTGGPEPVLVPPDRYYLWGYQEHIITNKKKTSFLEVSSLNRQGRMQIVNVTAGRTEEITIGSPIIGLLTTQPQGQAVRFRLDVVDSSGRTVRNIWKRSRPAFPVITVLDSRGERVGSFEMEYEHGESLFFKTWRNRKKLKGQFTAEVQWDPCGFKFKAEKITFTIK